MAPRYKDRKLVTVCTSCYAKNQGWKLTTLVHYADINRSDNYVTALCYKQPREIPLSVSWTMSPEDITCSKCKRMLADRLTRGGKHGTGESEPGERHKRENTRKKDIPE
jgi:hypothetical protein